LSAAAYFKKGRPFLSCASFGALALLARSLRERYFLWRTCRRKKDLILFAVATAKSATLFAKSAMLFCEVCDAFVIF
jgi:hypothetical protein